MRRNATAAMDVNLDSRVCCSALKRCACSVGLVPGLGVLVYPCWMATEEKSESRNNLS